MKKSRLSSISAIIIGTVLAIPLLVFGFLTFQNVLTRASNTEPTEVTVLRTTDTTATITWLTGEDTQGVIEYGTSPSQLVFFAPEAVASTTHRVEITLLQPDKTYYYVVRINGERFDNEGVPWQFTTKQAGTGAENAGTGGQPEPSGQQQNPQNPAQPPSNGSETPQTPATTCPQTTNCTEIQKQLGKGCSTSDYLKCLRSQQAQ
jgi:hypothetical protein